MKLQQSRVRSVLTALAIFMMWLAIILILVRRNLTIDLPILWVSIALLVLVTVVRKRRSDRHESSL